jgi:nitrogen fixation protein FixH
MLIVSMCVVGISAVSAAEVSDSTSVVYLKPNSNWTKDNARFAIYVFNSTKNAWADMNDDDGDGYYSVAIPEGDWSNIIFCRMSSTATANNWNNKWNQTSDLTIPDNANCYVVKDGTWEKGGGEWISYDPSGSSSETTTTATETTKEVIKGDADSYYLFGYINGANYGCEEDYENAGEYKFVDGTVTVNFDELSYVAVKTGDNSSWYMTDGWVGVVNEVVLYPTAKLGEDANKLAVPAGEVTFTLAENEDGTLTLSYTSDETPSIPEGTDPAEDTTTPVVNGDYYLFGYINGANYGCEEDYENIGDYQFVDGQLTVTFDELSYVAVKTADNSNWYMTDGWVGVVNETVLYPTAKLGEDANKLAVPAGEVTFTLAENADGTLTLSYTSDETPSIPEGTDPAEDTTTPVVNGDYYLFGSINGADYGCEDYYETIGDYHFVNGKLTATFDTLSYVGVKTGDNKNWYMTDGWVGVVNETVLYPTSKLGEDANKLVVPAGEVTFTLAENADGTLTLSYTSDETPSIPSSTDPTEEPTTPVVNGDYYLFGSINGADYGCEEDYETIGDYHFVNGKLTATFDTLSYVAVKTGDNKNWYMTDGWVGVVNETVLYPTSKLGEDANKLVVPAGEVTFTLAENADGTLTLSYTSDETPSIPSNTDPIDPTTPSQTVDYYLFGSINGADYGCEDDYANMGEYKFVDGKLTATFDTVSYVGVKTTDNATWYMTKEWLGEVTTATLYSTALLDENANKLMVPAGEVTFTLTTNDDGTVELSYTVKEDPTEPTTEPTTQPTAGASIIGDISLDLAETANGVYTAETKLSAGTYNFKINLDGKEYGKGTAYTDYIDNVLYKTSWSSATPFTATGGTYTFTFDSNTKKLTVEKASTAIAAIIGDINLDLADTNTSGVYSATTELAAGTYNFKVRNDGVELGSGTAYKDTIASQSFKASWKSSTPFTATGGTYVFTFNANTNKLSVEYLANGVSLVGDLDLNLVETSNGVYTATTELAAGTYNFKVRNDGVELGSGTAYKDTIESQTFKASWKSSTPFTATGGTYVFTFNANTNKLSVEYLANGVSLVGDIDLNLKETSDGVYTATTELAAGTYNFKVRNDGVELGSGTAYTDTIESQTFKASWKSSTPFTATGGTYTFTFDANKNKLSVEYLASGVSIFGDINLSLVETSDSVYTATTELAAGTYSFKVRNDGVEYGKGATYTDAIKNVQLKTIWKTATTLEATGGTYTFTFDTNTNKITVKMG